MLRRIFLGLVTLGVLAAIAGIGALVYAYNKTDIPDPQALARAQSSIVYYADGKTEMGRFTGEVDRESVPLEQVPDHMQKAILAAEDRGFYQNKGISPCCR